MPALTESILFLFIGLALLAMVAGVGALLLGKVLSKRRMQAEMAGNGARSWGGRDHERVRTKYFEKERRARAQRARYRHTRQAHGASANGAPEGDVPTAPVNLERLHGETLGLERGLEGRITPEQVRRAYKQRVREYHPDQVARLGVKLRVLAEEETKRINEAYAYFRKRYGF